MIINYKTDKKMCGNNYLTLRLHYVNVQFTILQH